ncbi:metallophosphoesterase [Thermospira aquatica]|uniref:Metallophosphoesterase n=1 Tax=Thermospira aquatica TaxID=2828656 RepID=A0AAX3BDR3_9SPIR|nr:metallophosphoesterase [Thermospira aquatica]URA10283.1 metallophosphoesterase [Thermospira aquatica]
MFVLVILGILLLLMALLWVVYAYREGSRIHIEHLTLYTDGIKKGLSIMHLSDLHLFKNMSSVRLARIQEVIRGNLKKPVDFIFLTGDLIDKNSGIDVLERKILPLLQAEGGVFAVLGNHDYFEYNVLHVFSPLFFLHEKKSTDVERLLKVLKNGGVRVLRNEVLQMTYKENKLTLVGVDNFLQGRYSWPHIQIPEDNSYKMVLAHFPDVIHHIKGRVDVVFSGHTHGGQITVWGYPVTAKAKIRRREARGASIHDTTVLYVSKGVGVSHYLPLRFFAHPDVTMIRIEVADEKK